MKRPPLPQLAIFAAVIRHGSFRAAAAALAIAPSAVSHAVAALEERLGVRLIARTTRAVAPTEAGQRLIERLAPALAEIDGALAAAIEAGERPAGTLRLTTSRGVAQLVLAGRLGSFARRYPDIVLDLVIEDRFSDVVEGGFDAGIRLGENLQRDMIAVKLSPPLRFAMVASPLYWADHPAPRHPDDLAQHRCLRFRFSSGRLYQWELEKDGTAMTCAVSGPLIVGDDATLVQAAIDGAGIAFLFEDRVRAHVAAGRLVRVMADWCPAFDGAYVYYPSRRQMRPALRAFIDFFRWPNGMAAASRAGD